MGALFQDVGYNGVEFSHGSRRWHLRGTPLPFRACVVGWHGDCKARREV